MNLKREFPERITVELTNRCNLNCSFCPRHIVDMNTGFISPELFYKIVDEAKNNLPVGMVFFFRGESLLHPQLTEFISYAKEAGLAPLQLASNGLELDEQIAQKIIESGLDFISFSLDTNNDEIYSKSRQYGDLKKSRENVIKFCNKVAERRANGLHAPEVQVSTVDVEEYRSEQKDFIDFWLNYADKVRVYIEHSSDNNLGSISADNLNSKIERKLCKKVNTDLVIYWDGNIGLCNHDWDNKLDIGNLNKKSIKDIWNSEKYNKIRAMHENNSYIDNITCKNCDHWMVYYLPDGFLGKIYLREEKESCINPK